MVRVGLTLYLIFAAGDEPGLCWWPANGVPSEPLAKGKLRTSLGLRGSHSTTGADHFVQGDKQNGESPPPMPGHCREGVPRPVTISVAKFSLNADSVQLFTLSQAFAPGVLSAVSPLTWHLPGTNARFSFASLKNARGIVIILQTLRC